MESLDLFPTLIDLCRPAFSKTQNKLDGDSLGPLLRTGVSREEDVAISYWTDAISVRDRNHRLVYNKKTKVSKLYDLSVDSDNPIDSAEESPDIVNRLEAAILESSK